MADSRLRELERRFSESGSIEDEAALLREQVRTGIKKSQNIWLAAKFGHAASRLIHQTSQLDNLLGLPEEMLNPFWMSRIAILACQHFRRHWNVRLHIDNPLAWLESQGGTHTATPEEVSHSLLLKMELDGVVATAGVPMSRMSTSYPGFHNLNVWHEMLQAVRHTHFSRGKDYILNPPVWIVPEVTEQRLEKKISPATYYGHVSTLYLQDAEWAEALISMHMEQEKVHYLDFYAGCLTLCLSAGGTHEAINKGMIEWALK